MSGSHPSNPATFPIGSAIVVVSMALQIAVAKAFGFGPSLVIYPAIIVGSLLWGRRNPQWRRAAWIAVGGSCMVLCIYLASATGIAT